MLIVAPANGLFAESRIAPLLGQFDPNEEQPATETASAVPNNRRNVKDLAGADGLRLLNITLIPCKIRDS